MQISKRFPYIALKNALGETLFRPMLRVVIARQDRTLDALGLVDSGADVNVLPYDLGVALGLAWDDQPYGIQLSGNLAKFEARGVVLSVTVGDLSPVDLAFAWTRARQAPLIFGHTNFFEVFDTCFYRTERYFSVTLREFQGGGR